jgi:hypothetical protein
MQFLGLRAELAIDKEEAFLSCPEQAFFQSTLPLPLLNSLG